MAVLMTSYVRADYVDSAEYAAVTGVAASLLEHLNTPDAQDLLALANLPGQSSAMVQASFTVFATELGFVDNYAPGVMDEDGNVHKADVEATDVSEFYDHVC